MSKLVMPQRETLVEALSHIPNPGLLTMRSRQGGGTHRTPRLDHHRDRRQARQQARSGTWD